jgi:hypothetical protein
MDAFVNPETLEDNNQVGSITMYNIQVLAG